MHTEDQPRTPRHIVHAFDTIMEIAVSTLPLILVVLGIGMMSFSPRRSATPLFRSSTEAQAFFAQNGMQLSFEKPIVLVASTCPSCATLTSSLREHGIQFEEQNIDGNQAAAALRAQAERVSGTHTLPQVVLGDQLINPAPYSIKIALRRFKK